MPIELVGGRRFLKVDQAANLRAGSKVSKIWEHGFGYRSLDNGLRDKYWRCKYCKAKKLLKITEAGNTTTSHAIRHLTPGLPNRPTKQARTPLGLCCTACAEHCCTIHSR